MRQKQMNSQKLQPRESLNKAFLKINPFRNDIETFKKHLKNLIAKINESESEEFHNSQEETEDDLSEEMVGFEFDVTIEDSNEE